MKHFALLVYQSMELQECRAQAKKVGNEESIPQIRKSLRTRRNVKSCIKMCDFFGGSEVNLCLFADDEFVSFDRNHTLVSQDRKEGLIQRIAIPTLSRLTKYASDYGIQLLLEPI